MNKENLTLLMVNNYPDYIDPAEWSAALRIRVPTLEFRLWPERGDPADIDIVMIDKGTPPGFFEGMTRLRAVAYLGAGIDGLLLEDLPPGVGVVRLATRELASTIHPAADAVSTASRRRLCNAADQPDLAPNCAR